MNSESELLIKARKLHHQGIADFRVSIRRKKVVGTVEALRKNLNRKYHAFYSNSIKNRYERVMSRPYISPVKSSRG